MPRTRRVVRKTRPSRYKQLDDHLWPLVVAFFVLGGFLCGTVLAYLRPDDPRWYANAWTWLVAIPIVVVGSLTWLALTGNRVLRRTMQLAVVMGLIFHLLLLILAIETNIFSRIWTEVVTATQPVQREEVRVPEYSSWQHDPQRRAERDFEQPVETELPEPVADEVEPQELEQRPTVVEPQPLPVPDPEQTVDPKVVKRKVQDQATPRQREEMSKLSRKVNEAPSQPVQSVTVPNVIRRAERQREPLDATNTPLQPRRAEVNARRQVVRPQPRPAEDPSPTRMARRVQDKRPETQEPATVAVDRQLAQPQVGATFRCPIAGSSGSGPRDAARRTSSQQYAGPEAADSIARSATDGRTTGLRCSSRRFLSSSFASTAGGTTSRDLTCPTTPSK